MYRRSDITVLANQTPLGGVYINVKNADGTAATIYDDSAAEITQPMLSDINGAFAYNVDTEGTYTEEYRLTSGGSVRKELAVEISADANIRTDLASPASGKGAALVGTANGGTVQSGAVLYSFTATIAGSDSRNVVVGGGALEDVTTGYANTVMGYNAMNLSQKPYRNVAIGEEALRDCVGDPVDEDVGSNQVAVGAGALRACTTGFSNTIVGRAGATALTTGSYNSGLGHATLFGLTTGSDNSAVGDGAAQGLTIGVRNSAFGKEALNASTSGADNVAIGYRAGSLGISVASMVAVGAWAGRNNTADNCVFVGAFAGEDNTSGSQNVFVGRQAGTNNTTGGQNTALGENALFAQITASSCVAVGANSLVGTLASFNTAVGAGAGGADATGSAVVGAGGDNTFIGARAGANNASAAGTIAIGKDAVAKIASGATSADAGPGIAIGSASTPVGFRGDGTIYPTAGAIAGYMIVNVNGTDRKIALYALS